MDAILVLSLSFSSLHETSDRVNAAANVITIHISSEEHTVLHRACISKLGLFDNNATVRWRREQCCDSLFQMCELVTEKKKELASSYSTHTLILERKSERKRCEMVAFATLNHNRGLNT